MGCEKRVFRNNQIRFDTLPDNKSWYGSQKNRMPFRGRHDTGLRTLPPNWNRR